MKAIGDTGSASLLPPTAEDRAMMRLFTELCSSSFSYFPILRARDETMSHAALETFKSGLTDVDTFLRYVADRRAGERGPFLFGNQFTLAECSVAPFVQRACVILPMGIGNSHCISPIDICDGLGLKRLKEWIEAVLVQPSVIKTGVPKDDLMKNMEKMLARFEAMEKEQLENK